MQERRLAAMHPILDANYSTGAWTGLNGWNVLNAAQTRFAHETVIDLSGYAMESLTFFPAAIGLQDPGIYETLYAVANSTGSMNIAASSPAISNYEDSALVGIGPMII